MNFISNNMSARYQTVGKAEFVVISRFCGYETIMQKLTRLMEDELTGVPETQKSSFQNEEKTLDI